MSLLSKVRAFFARGRPKRLDEWFFVSFDDKAVHMRVEPPGKAAWSQSCAWDHVIRVCFKAENMWVSDGIYVFTSERPESYVIPTEANGGAELAIEAAGSTEGLFAG